MTRILFSLSLLLLMGCPPRYGNLYNPGNCPTPQYVCDPGWEYSWHTCRCVPR